MSVRTRTTLFNAALLRTGNSQVTEGDGDDYWQALEANYPDIVRSAFEGGKFPFGRGRVELTSRSDGSFGFDDAYTYPTTVLHVDEVFFDGISASDLCEEWELDADDLQLMVNARNRKIEIEFIKEGQEHRWSASFAKGIQRQLEAVLKDVEQEFQEAISKDEDGDAILGMASVKASKNRSPKPYYRRGTGRVFRRRRGG